LAAVVRFRAADQPRPRHSATVPPYFASRSCRSTAMATLR